MTSSQLQEYARFGAQARLQAIEEERSAIVRAFPDLGRASGWSNGASSQAGRGRKGMSASQRRAVGERMKAYWAKRRGENGAATPRAESASAASPKASSKGKGMPPGRQAQAEKMRAYWAARRAEKQAGVDGAPAEAANVTAETSSAAKPARTATRKGGKKAGRRQGRKK